MDGVVKSARKNKRTTHITFFDLEDAFGSVPHSLIMDTLRRNHLPENICTYLSLFYANCRAVVETPSWRSQPFPFCRGVFQGDPLSPTVFLMVFNPVLLKLKNVEEKYGYKLCSDGKTTSVITLPYADDFCLITSDLRTHRKLISEIHDNINSMGMRLKPSKCRSLSIQSGSSKDVPFHIGDNRIPSIRDEEQKFLGRLLFFSGKSEETFKHIYEILKDALEHIEASLIRSEYKLWILKNYLLPSKRFLLTVHTLSPSHLSRLDTFVDKYTKKWAGLPRSATNVVIHSEQALDIPSITTIYTEAHNTSHARTRLQGDSVINDVLDHTLDREAEYVRGQTTTMAEKVFRDTIHLNTVDDTIPTYTGNRAKQLTQIFNTEIRTKVRDKTRRDIQENLASHAANLQVQGNLLTLAAKEKVDLVWKSSMFQLKSGTLKFMLNAAIDTLPTPANLKRWKYGASDKCKLCGNRGTTNHFLNCCTVMLNTARYTWRHNNLINYIVTNVDKIQFKVFSDLPGWEAPGGGTIPSDLCVTNLKPDIVIVDETKKKLHIFELTVPLTMNIDQRHNEKSHKYTPFLTDITNYTCTVNCFEVSSTGYINDRNKSTLTTLHSFMRKDMKKSTFFNNLNSLAWYGSYQLWLTREDKEFAAPPFLIPHLQ